MFYTPHIHNLGFLRIQAERLDRDSLTSGRSKPRKSSLREAQGRLREGPLLKAYRISAEELAWLGARVEELGSVVQTICMERIKILETAVGI